MKALRIGTRVCAFVMILQALVTAPGAAANCSGKTQDIHRTEILATMTYYAIPGKEDALYQGLARDDETLMRHGVAGYMLFRGPGGSGPAAMWQMTFPNFAAHDAWLKQADKVDPGNPPYMPFVRRMEHRHYTLHDGWFVTLCP
jgi:hypothetical protein